MNQHRFVALTRSLGGLLSRRRLLGGLAGTGLGLGLGAARLTQDAGAKRKGRGKGKDKNKNRRGLCKRNGAKCSAPGKDCKKQFCLKAPFTIEAIWAGDDPYAYMFVPPRDETTGQSPHIDYRCSRQGSACEEAYPFACTEDASTNPGIDTTTVYQLLPGKYEYWLELFDTLAGDVTVALKDANGRVVRRWTNPAKTSAEEQGWHVFDFDGEDGRVTSIDALNAPGPMPEAAHDPYTDVCPAG